jgi:hypothetical protein
MNTEQELNKEDNLNISLAKLAKQRKNQRYYLKHKETVKEYQREKSKEKYDNDHDYREHIKKLNRERYHLKKLEKIEGSQIPV